MRRWGLFCLLEISLSMAGAIVGQRLLGFDIWGGILVSWALCLPAALVYVGVTKD